MKTTSPWSLKIENVMGFQMKKMTFRYRALISFMSTVENIRT